MFLCTFVVTQTSLFAADDKIVYWTNGGPGPHNANTPRDKWPWLYGTVLAYELQTSRPLVGFGACKEPDKKGRYLYMLVFKTPKDFPANEKPKGNPYYEFKGIATNGSQECTLAVEFAKKKVDIYYKIDLDAKKQTIVKQVLKIGGTDLKEGEPHVFVVDLTKEKIAYHPIKVELPDEVPDMTDEKDENWEAPIMRAVEQLKKKSPELKKLLESAPEK
jgi:hypothetical protein